MRKKVLFVANHKGFSKFNAPYMQWFRDQGWQVDNASPGIMVDCVDHHYDIDIRRSPFSIGNFKAYKQLKNLIDRNNYDIIHLHTPMGAVLGRMAAREARKKGTKVIYTAHGFHFFKGAPLKNWLMYYPVELLQSRMMDALVTINEEDYQLAERKHLANGNVYKINGVGVNLKKFHPLSLVERASKRRDLGLGNADFVILYVSQFIPRKNHIWIIALIPKIIELIPNAKFVFAGGGALESACKARCKELGVCDKVNFLGFRDDIAELCGMADVHVSSSLQEGLAVNNLEAMASGCPLLISDVRGHKDVCIDGRNGFLFSLDEPKKFLHGLSKLAASESLHADISKNNVIDARKFEVGEQVNNMARIYKSLIDEQ